jgi:bifunctional non-homologous end joining protein LigD
MLPTGKHLIAQPKLDGWRCLIVKNGREVRFYSRAKKDLTPRLPIHMSALANIRPRTLILDCELVALDHNGSTDFYGLASTLRRNPERVHLYAFDILRHNNTDLRPLPLARRLQRLKSVVLRADLDCLHAVESSEDLPALFQACQRLGFEGIVVKSLDEPYVSGNCRTWLKIKTETWKAANKARWKRFSKQPLSTSRSASGGSHTST